MYVSGIDHLLKCIVEDFGNDACQKGTADLKTRVGVHLYQVKPEIVIKHEIVAKKLKIRISQLFITIQIDGTYLKAVLKPLGINFGKGSFESVGNELLHLWEDVSVEVKV